MPSTSPRFSVTLFIGLMLAAVAAGSLIAFSLLAGSSTDLMPPRVRAGQISMDVPPVVLQRQSEPDRTKPDRTKPRRPAPTAVAAVPVPDEVLPLRFANPDDSPQAPDGSAPNAPKDRDPVARRDVDGGEREPGKEWKHDKDWKGYDGDDTHGHVARPSKPAHPSKRPGHPSHPATPKPQGVANGHHKSKGKGHKGHPHH